MSWFTQPNRSLSSTASSSSSSFSSSSPFTFTPPTTSAHYFSPSSPMSSALAADTAPRRRAPHPPYYVPRRMRPRHIRMREPAFSGLFTVSELDEVHMHAHMHMAAATAGTGVYSCSPFASTSTSSTAARMECERPRSGSVDMDFDMSLELEFEVPLASSSSSTSILSADSDSIATPSITDDDSFLLDVPLDVDMEADNQTDTDFFTTTPSVAAPSAFVSRLTKSTRTARRPAPLDLSAALHHRSSRSSLNCASQKSAEINRWSREVDSLTPRLASFAAADANVLLPAFGDEPAAYSPVTPTPISASSAYTSASAGAADPLSALESLFGECAEPDTSFLSSPRPSSSYSSQCSPRSRSASPDPFTIASFPLPPLHTPVLSPGSASTTASFASVPRTPVTPAPAMSRRTVSGGNARQPGDAPRLCPGAPSPKSRRDKERLSERERTVQDKEAWATRHADLFSLTYSDSRGAGEMGRAVSMPVPKQMISGEHKVARKERRVGLGIKGVDMGLGSPSSKRTSQCASPASSSISASSSKSRKLPSRPRLPAHWMV